MDNLINPDITKVLRDLRTVDDRDLILSDSGVAKKIKDEIKKLPTVHLTFAIRPTKGILNEIDDFFIEKIGKKILIDWNVDEEILGGVSILYKGNYGNYSISKKI